MERKITILSIDDEENIRFALGELFHFQGWEACSAPNVKKGLEQFRLHKPDIVLIDYHMPGINGVEGVQMLRSEERRVGKECRSRCLQLMKVRRWLTSFFRRVPVILP